MSADQDERFTLTPLAVATRALGAERWAEDALAELGRFARLGSEPGEVGVIVFPAEGAPYFDVADGSQLQASGEAADAVYPPMEIRDAEPARYVPRLLTAEEAAAQKGGA